jgi:hypothetical protein
MMPYWIPEAWILLSSNGEKNASFISSVSGGCPATVQPNLSSSNLGMKRIPERPSSKAFRKASSPMALGATTPMPVTTMRWFIDCWFLVVSCSLFGV